MPASVRDPILPASRLRTCVRGINTMINISCSHITGAWISIPSSQPKQRLAKLFKQIQSNTLHLFQFPRRTRHLILLFKSFYDGESSHCGRSFSSFVRSHVRSLLSSFVARTLTRLLLSSFLLSLVCSSVRRRRTRTSREGATQKHVAPRNVRASALMSDFGVPSAKCSFFMCVLIRTLYETRQFLAELREPGLSHFLDHDHRPPSFRGERGSTYI